MHKAFVTLIVSLALLSACGPVSKATATPVPADIATVESTEIPSATPIALRDFGRTNECCAGDSFADGRYRLPPFLFIPASIEITGNWRFLNLELRNILAIVRGETVYGDAEEWIAFMVLKTSDPEEQFLADVLAAPEWNVITFPTDVTLGTFSGWQIDTQAKPNPSLEGDSETGVVAGSQEIAVIEDYLTEVWYTSTPEAFTRIIGLHVGDRLLVILLEASPAMWETFLADTQPILDSLIPVE